MNERARVLAVTHPVSEAEFRAAYALAKNDVELGVLLLMPRVTVWKRRQAYALPRLRGHGQGYRPIKTIKCAGLSVDRLRDLHTSGMNDYRIAAEMGISRATVHHARVALGLEANAKKGWQCPGPGRGGKPLAYALALLLFSAAAHANGWQSHPVERPDPFAAMRNIENGQPGYSCCSGEDCAYTDTCTTTDGAAGVIGPDNSCHAVTDAASMTRGCPSGHTSACFIGTKSSPRMICACVGDS